MINRSFGVVLFLMSASAVAESSTGAAAPQDPIPTYSFWLEAPVALGVQTIAVRYERVLLPKLSISAAVELGGSYSASTIENLPAYETLTRAGSAHVGISHYFGEKALSGVYVHARLGVIGSEMSTVTASTGSSVWVLSSTGGNWFGPSAAAMIGYALVSESGFALQFGVGVHGGYQWTGFRYAGAPSSGSNMTVLWVNPATRISIGWAL